MTSRNVKYLTVSAMLSALSVIFLALGSVIEVLDLTAGVLASLLVVYAVIEMGKGYPWMIWLVTSLLGLLLLPVKGPAVFYALFAGFYPIVKEKMEKQRWVISWLLKLALFHLCLAGLLLLVRLFAPGTLGFEAYPWMRWVFYPLCLFCFVLYDVALSRAVTFYLVRLRNRFGLK